MNANDLILDEIPLTTLREAGLWAEFLHVQAPWIEAGVSRWLDLLRTEGPWPVFVVAAWEQGAPDHLLGTIVGVWAPAPVTRFDVLLETAEPGGRRGANRPTGGVWHFVAATVGPDAAGRNLGRLLVGGALHWMDTHASNDALARTLSPAVGLPGLLEVVQSPPIPLHTAVLQLANAKGYPALEILRLHLGAGARLEAVLPNSRRDEVRSGRVTLRFAYDRDPDARRAQALRYQAWVERRAAAVATGIKHGDLWEVGDCGDADVSDVVHPG